MQILVFMDSPLESSFLYTYVQFRAGGNAQGTPPPSSVQQSPSSWNLRCNARGVGIAFQPVPTCTDQGDIP